MSTGEFVVCCTYLRKKNEIRFRLEPGGTLKSLLYSFDHGKSHVYAKHGVIGSFPGSPTDAIVTIAQNFDPELLVFLRTENNGRINIIY